MKRQRCQENILRHITKCRTQLLVTIKLQQLKNPKYKKQNKSLGMETKTRPTCYFTARFITYINGEGKTYLFY